MTSKLLKTTFWLCMTSHGFAVGLKATVVLQQNATEQVKYCTELLQVQCNWRFTFYMQFSSMALGKLKGTTGD